VDSVLSLLLWWMLPLCVTARWTLFKNTTQTDKQSLGMISHTEISTKCPLDGPGFIPPSEFRVRQFEGSLNLHSRRLKGNDTLKKNPLFQFNPKILSSKPKLTGRMEHSSGQLKLSRTNRHESISMKKNEPKHPHQMIRSASSIEQKAQRKLFKIEMKTDDARNQTSTAQTRNPNLASDEAFKRREAGAFE
jgi:hypothetical protein